MFTTHPRKVERRKKGRKRGKGRKRDAVHAEHVSVKILLMRLSGDRAKVMANVGLRIQGLPDTFFCSRLPRKNRESTVIWRPKVNGETVFPKTGWALHPFSLVISLVLILFSFLLNLMSVIWA